LKLNAPLLCQVMLLKMPALWMHFYCASMLCWGEVVRLGGKSWWVKKLHYCCNCSVQDAKVCEIWMELKWWLEKLLPQDAHRTDTSLDEHNRVSQRPESAMNSQIHPVSPAKTW
jgi:hypothetical protein